MFDKKILESAELYQNRYRNFATLIIFPILALFCGLVIFALFAKKDLVVTTTGDIEPNQIIAQIQSTSNSPIVENYLTEGKVVKENQVLLKYNSDSDATQLDALVHQKTQLDKQKVQLLVLQKSVMDNINGFGKADEFGYASEYQNYQAQIQNVKSSISKVNQAVADQNSTIANEQNQISNQIANLNQQISEIQTIKNAVISNGAVDTNNSFKAQYDSYQSYQSQLNALPKDSTSETQKVSLKNQFLASLQTSLTSLQSQTQSLNLQSSGLNKSNSTDNSLSSQLLALKFQESQSINKELTTLNAGEMDLQAKISLQKQANKNSEVLSNEKGVVHLLPNISGLKTIPSGTPVAEIYPTFEKKTQVKITAYIPSFQLSGIKLGQTMRYTVLQSLPKPEILIGKIRYIDSAPTSEKGMNFYKVEATATLQKKDFLNLRYGLEGKIVVVIGNKTYFDYYKDKVMGKE